jgi:hypothetical protein
MITLVLYIGSLQNLTTWFPCGRGRILFILGSLGQGHCYYKYNFLQQGRFHMITLVLYIGSLPNLATWFPTWKGKNPIYFGAIRSKVKVTITINRIFDKGLFPHDNFSSVYWIFTKLGHMIPLWKGKNPIYFGVITIILFDNLYRWAYFVMHTFLVQLYNGENESYFNEMMMMMMMSAL